MANCARRAANTTSESQPQVMLSTASARSSRLTGLVVSVLAPTDHVRPCSPQTASRGGAQKPGELGSLLRPQFPAGGSYDINGKRKQQGPTDPSCAAFRAFSEQASVLKRSSTSARKPPTEAKARGGSLRGGSLDQQTVACARDPVIATTGVFSVAHAIAESERTPLTSPPKHDARYPRHRLQRLRREHPRQSERRRRGDGGRARV